jgi:NADPH-dependent curcumin reductase
MDLNLMNHQWTLARTPPLGWPSEGDFSYSGDKIPVPGDRQCLTRTIYLSLDPYQWGRRRSGVEAVGDICHGRTVSIVEQSRDKNYAEGDLIFNTNGWQEYGLTGHDISVFNYMHPRKLIPENAPISTALGVLGMLGLTAYSGVYLQCKPVPGETVVISAASGGVGQNAGQIAKIMGCRVVGITGTTEKCQFVTETLGFDAGINHKSENFQAELASACPEGIDIYFENVGGKVFDSILPLLNRNSRITLCGLISQYGNDDPSSGQAIWKKAGEKTFRERDVLVHPLFVGNFVEDYQEQFLSDMSGWVKDGLIKYREDHWRGLEKAPDAFSAMLAGDNFGKTIVQVSEDSTLDESVDKSAMKELVLG